MCQSETGPSRTGCDTALDPAHAGSGDESPGVVTELMPGGAVSWKAQTPLAWATSRACSGPASSPMKAMLVASEDISIPDAGVMTNQLSRCRGILAPGPESAYAYVRPENRPITPCDATTSAEGGMRACTLASV